VHLIGELEDNVEDSLLNIVQFKKSCDEERNHVRDSSPPNPVTAKSSCIKLSTQRYRAQFRAVFGDC